MLATINLFIYILKSPTAPTVQSDIALLDIASGHFGHIYHLTSSHVSFSFPREAIRIAERAVQLSRTEEGVIKMPDAIISTPHASMDKLFDSRVGCLQGIPSLLPDSPELLRHTFSCIRIEVN
jgi:hypothetical protein